MSENANCYIMVVYTIGYVVYCFCSWSEISILYILILTGNEVVSATKAASQSDFEMTQSSQRENHMFFRRWFFVCSLWSFWSRLTIFSIRPGSGQQGARGKIFLRGPPYFASSWELWNKAINYCIYLFYDDLLTLSCRNVARTIMKFMSDFHCEDIYNRTDQSQLMW